MSPRRFGDDECFVYCLNRADWHPTKGDRIAVEATSERYLWHTSRSPHNNTHAQRSLRVDRLWCS
ncbi:MAG: hypothetical protein RMX68_033510 [Aulosira sp. ZfuVER01]|nr:hypothetical protein [Aulosira sp. ZfuVER01]MDZ7999795.1 hypothetical protein [Aulosira sp. DedVER01a]MDZ8049837.1 hypothetical protein [Aulosira sp. ZfuCHP01]